MGLAVGTQEHIVGEEILPRLLGVDFNFDLVFRAGAGVSVAYVDRFLVLGVVQYFTFQRVVVVCVNGLIDLSPVDRTAGNVVFNDEAIQWRAAGELTGVDDQRAGIGEVALVSPDGCFYECGDGKVLL
jgi:hypothetical protein